MRVVSLLPAATEIVAFLGATEHLVGVTHECDYPDIIRSRARVTKSAIAQSDDPAKIDADVRARSAAGNPLYTLDETRIRSLHPDLLLTQGLCEVCAVRESDVRALAERLSPPPEVVTLGGMTLEGVYSDIEAVGKALDARSEAEELLVGLHERVHRVHGTLSSAGAPRPRVAVIEWTSPIYLAGHWGPDQVRRAGGVDVMGKAGEHSRTVEMQELIDADPEIVLIAPCGYSLSRSIVEARRVTALPEWQWLSGRQVWAIDANGLVSRPGPRIVDGIEAMARIFNPSLFNVVDPRHAQRIS